MKLASRKIQAGNLQLDAAGNSGGHSEKGRKCVYEELLLSFLSVKCRFSKTAWKLCALLRGVFTKGKSSNPRCVGSGKSYSVLFKALGFALTLARVSRTAVGTSVCIRNSKSEHQDRKVQLGIAGG